MGMKSHFVILALILVVFFSGCTEKTDEKGDAVPGSAANASAESGAGAAAAAASEGADGSIKIGVLQSLTGDLGAYGGPMSDAMKLASKQINENGGLLGKKLELLIEDDQTNNVAAVDAANKLVNVDKVPAIIGDTGSGQSMSIIDITTGNGVFQISSSNTGTEFTNYNDSDLYFRTAPSDTLQGSAMAKLAKERGYTTVSTVVINNPYGVGFEEVFIKAFEADGGEVLETIRYDPSQTIFDSEVQKIAASNPQFVMMVSYPETGSLILRTAYEKGALTSTPWLLSEGLKAGNMAELTGKDSSGKYIAAGLQGLAPDENAGGAAYEVFRNQYKAEYGKEPGIYCTNSYDALAVVALAIEKANSATGRAIADNIRSVSNPPGIEVSDLKEALNLVKDGKDIDYQGTSGNITFDEHGDVSGSYTVWTISENGSIVQGEKVAV